MSPLYDAHNHLQDDRIHQWAGNLVDACREIGVRRMVVNGASEGDWPAVRTLAATFPMVLPSFGCHPWYLHERTAGWLEVLTSFLNDVPSAVGEIGLDRWKPGLSYEGQEEVFVAQLRLAAERNLPVSIHCLEAWGRMEELLRLNPRPARGFLLHSYGGPREMVKRLADLGAYFSFPGYYAHERKTRQRETFQHVPAERLLVETDAPDQRLPDALNRFPLTDAVTELPLNHPANLGAVYECVSALRGLPPIVLATQVEQNFLRLFGGL